MVHLKRYSLFSYIGQKYIYSVDNVELKVMIFYCGLLLIKNITNKLSRINSQTNTQFLVGLVFGFLHEYFFSQNNRTYI
jgi:hypothetical protein